MCHMGQDDWDPFLNGQARNYIGLGLFGSSPTNGLTRRARKPCRLTFQSLPFSSASLSFKLNVPKFWPSPLPRNNGLGLDLLARPQAKSFVSVSISRVWYRSTLMH